MPTAHLDGRATIAVTGEDAETFLQNILTTDLTLLGSDQALPGALLTPQGKILFDFLISRIPGGFRLDCPAGAAADFHRRLTMYRLRAKVTIGQPDESLVGVSWSGGSADGPVDGAVADRRFRPVENVVRSYAGLPGADAEASAWKAFRIAAGIPESGSDYALGDAFPHDALLDQMDGVGFRKGCYVGQEVVSRMQHRGTARRRVLIATGLSALPPEGTEVTAGGRPIGGLGSVEGRSALAMVRIDRVKDAVDAGQQILAGDVPLTLEIPVWARFTFPATPDADA